MYCISTTICALFCLVLHYCGYISSLQWIHVMYKPKSLTVTWLALGESYFTLQWRHNERDGVSNHQPHDFVYSTVYSDTDQRKHLSSVSLAFVRVIHRWPVNSPHKGPVTRKMFPFDDVIMWAQAGCIFLGIYCNNEGWTSNKRWMQQNHFYHCAWLTSNNSSRNYLKGGFVSSRKVLQTYWIKHLIYAASSVYLSELKI